MARTILHPPGTGETYWAGKSPITIKASATDTGGNISCLELSVPPGGGPVLHRHGREDEFFFVLEGTLTFVGDFGTREAPAESLIYVPQGALHSFENRTGQTARLLSFFVPGGFESYFREVCTTEPNILRSVSEFHARSRAIGGKYHMLLATDPAPEGIIGDVIFTGPGEGEALNIMGDRASILLPSEATGNRFCVFVEEGLPGAGVPPHIHFREDELFYILEGELTMMKPDGEEVVLRPGSFLYSPKGTPHAWFNRTNKVTRFLGIATPGGFDTFFRHIHDESEPGVVISTAHRYDIKFLPK